MQTTVYGRDTFKSNFKLNRTINAYSIFIGIVLIIILLSNAVNAAQMLKVSTNRYSVFSPWTGKPAAGVLSTDFTAYALFIDADGKPVSGANITFEIYSPAGKKVTKYDTTKPNGLANVSYDTINDFAASNDADYGTWNITAYLTSNSSIWGASFMKMEVGGDAISGCTRTYCHNDNLQIADRGGYPRSPYTEHYNQTSTRAEAAHTKANHVGKGCYYCHPGYAAIKTGSYGNTSDVHKNRTCDFCHGDWAYISNTTAGQGQGIPKMPSCYDCHPVYNNNPAIISTLANLLAGNSISVYSYNFDIKAPLTAHNGTNFSLTNSVPCIACHGPAHNITKPDPLPANTNTVTEPTQCISCHGQKHFVGTSCTDCHSQNAHAIVKPQGSGSAGNYTGNSSNCKTCHPAQYNAWTNTTHTSKLITRDDAKARGYPNPPGGYNWTNVSFAIGGKWKIRYVNDTGYIITNGGKNQFNVDDQLWTDYNKDTSKPYICGNCHNTGYLSNVTDETKEPFRTLRAQVQLPDGVYNNSLTPGFLGYWAENSIGCEACHGQGGDHVNGPTKLNIRNASVVRNTPGICGNCHSRPNTGEYENLKPYPDGVNDTLLNDTLYDSSPMPTVNYSKVGGHHEQWEDWKASVHANQSVNCVTCHGGHSISDPAYAGGPTGKTNFTNGTVYPAAVNKTCTDCHSAELPKHGYYTNSSDCISCHMPQNRKSSNKIDLRSHWFNTSALKSDKNGEIHGYNFPVLKNISNSCTICHSTQSSEVQESRHNKTLNISAPYCTDCHTSGYTSYIVNGSNTCTNSGCHAGKDVSMGSLKGDPADCTQCHFANTTQKFDKNTTLYRNSHILTVEYNFYNYNTSGIPLSGNGGAGKGMFPYYTCTLTCHNGVEQPSIEDNVIAWNESKHARSREGTSDSNAYCAKCKSPPNYNLSADKAYNASANYSRDFTINASDWQGIQCRICHNLHNETYSGDNQSAAYPLAFYNTTATRQANGSIIYDKMPNATVLCEKCHTTTTHDSKFAGYHKETLGFTCADCHVNKTINSNLTHTFEVKNTTSGVAGCEVCHNTADHTWSATSIHINKVTCEGCHDKTVSRNATGYAVSSDNNYGLYKDPTTSEWSSYKKSSGKPVTWPLHNINKNISCDKCHGTLSVFNGTIAPDFGNYSGSTACAGCHVEQYNKWRNTSHTSKLVTRVDAMAKGYPAPPNGDGNWSNVSFAIGGHWKIRYVDNYGYILTNGTVDGRTPGGPGNTQYNVDDQVWSHYNRNTTKPYNCGHCHTTGYLQDVSNESKEPWKTLRDEGIYPGGVYNNSLAPGFTGWWAENAIGCEACHGPGGNHIREQPKTNLSIRNASVLRNSPGICGDCHSRPNTTEYEDYKQYPEGVNDTLLTDTLYGASPMPTVNYSLVGGHHEQWEDWKASVHAGNSISCVTCHGGHSVSDPAYADGPNNKTKFTNGSVYPAAVNKTCTDCHNNISMPEDEWPKHGYYTNSSECISCHMPKNRKSSNKIDLRSHWFNVSALKNNKNTGVHAANFAALQNVTESCTTCHSSANLSKPIYTASVGMHKDINKSEGIGLLNSSDCKSCHYGASTTNIQTYICTDCHTQGNFSAPIISNHKPPKLTASPGSGITTTAYCSTCHNNSINKYVYSVNASVSHYGTNTTLIKPTVNQNTTPRFGFMNSSEASAYNKECNNCHNPSNQNYGNATLITTPHTDKATCNQCHVNASASNLHASTLGIPQAFGCKDCHTTYAYKYRAPNITGTIMAGAGKEGCDSLGCHGGTGDNGNRSLDNQTEHNINRNFAGTPGRADTVYLNNQASLSVSKGTIVTVTSKVNDTNYDASRVGGAEYYIDADPGIGRGTPMDASDGMYDAVRGAWENVTATIDTSGLSSGNHTVYVRGMDIGKQWSSAMSATLTVLSSKGYINGTVTNGSSPLAGVTVSTTGASNTTDSNGRYSLYVDAGTYDVTASKQPEYYDSTAAGKIVTPDNTTVQDFVLVLKPTGTITGTVTNV